jgi:membrane protein
LKKRISREALLFHKIKKFLKSGIWNIQLETLGGIKRFGTKFLKILLFSFGKLSQDQLLLRAPALAFFSLLSVVPLMALAFGVAKGFGLQDVLQKQLKTQLSLPGEAQTMILEFARNTLQKASGGLVAGLGLVFLFVAVTLVFSNIETSFNKIWGIKKGRSLSIKIRDYFSMIFIGTILLLISLSLTVAFTDVPSFFGYLKGVVSFFLGLVPYALVWFLFAFLIIFMPNRKISLRAGLFAGIVSGTLYQLFLNLYIRLQITVSVYNAIYGSFAALPLFLIWLQISWICLLFGAEISYAYENIKTMGFGRNYASISIRAQKMILLRIVHYIIRRFRDAGMPPPSAHQIADDLGISGQLVNQLLEDLVDNGLITMTVDDQHLETGYQPGVPPDELTVQTVLKSMEEKGMTNIPLKRDATTRHIEKIIAEYDRSFEESSDNVKIEDLG